MNYLDDTRVVLKYDMPLNEIIYDFFDTLKSKTKGYASVDYELSEYKKSELVKLDIYINNEQIDNYYYSDEIIKHFKRSEAAPSESVTTKVISEEDAEYEVVVWFDGVDTIYWYSEATRVYLNEDCNYMFYYMYEAEDFELNNFDASKMKTAEYMFYYYGDKSSGTILDLTNWNIENLERKKYCE